MVMLTTFPPKLNHPKSAKYLLFSLIWAIVLIFQPANANPLNGSTLNLIWCLPFAGTLLSIAIIPLTFPHLWHAHYGKIMLIWTAILLISIGWQFNWHTSIHLVLHAFIYEYLPFIILLTALFTISGGIALESNLWGTAKTNTILLAIGTLLAGIMGTTGAAMLMIRPLLRANNHRRYRQHIVIFFILLIGNIGGGLTPLGDPPLFLGFLKGVSFGWTLKHMLLPVAFNSLVLLSLFYLLDRYYLHHTDETTPPAIQHQHYHIKGKINLLLLLLVIGTILLSGLWNPSSHWRGMDIGIPLNALLRDGMLILLTLISLYVTAPSIRQHNDFNWQPIIEVSKLFSAIFITIAPVMAILQAGNHGSLHYLIQLVHNQNGTPINSLYFWCSGLLSGFLDNAPTYLIFFNLAGGDANHLMYYLPQTLIAISMGSVFMGALSYIGNAPNLMVKTIAEQQQIVMPSFFGYMLWSLFILLPLMALDCLIFL